MWRAHSPISFLLLGIRAKRYAWSKALLKKIVRVYLTAIPFYHFIDPRNVEKSEVRVVAEAVGA